MVKSKGLRIVYIVISKSYNIGFAAAIQIRQAILGPLAYTNKIGTITLNILLLAVKASKITFIDLYRRKLIALYSLLEKFY